jgi:SAM-dependent methyltransferase
MAIPASSPLLIQTHWSDFDSFDAVIRKEPWSLAPRAKAAFERVVLLCGDTPENDVVRSYAEEVGVECFAGDNDDVGLRVSQCLDHLGTRYAARVLLYHFMVDLDVVARSFELLDEHPEADHVHLPGDLDVKFAADVFTRSFIETARAVAAEADGPLERRLRFTPWSAAEVAPERFHPIALDRVPFYDESYFWKIRRFVDEHWPERRNKAGMPQSTYLQAATLLPEGTRTVADIACGWGDGTAVLARRFGGAVGVDYEPDQIVSNVERHRGVEGLGFRAGDATDPALFPESEFEAIVSIHSMEHLDDDRAFLRCCHRWLAPGGHLILEVPLLLRYPFPEVGLPLGEGHKREYVVADLLDLVREWFVAEECFGVSRGMYLPLDRARNAVMLHLRPRALSGD